MNNDLEQFTDLELEGMAHGNNPVANAYRELLAFRMAAKQAKPIGIFNQMVFDVAGSAVVFSNKEAVKAGFCSENGELTRNHQMLYTTPQPAHKEPDGWIKCSERLPDDESYVLVTNGKHTGMGAYLRDDHLEDDERWQDEHFEFINKQSKYPVTHWMPLPPNPEE